MAHRGPTKAAVLAGAPRHRVEGALRLRQPRVVRVHRRRGPLLPLPDWHPPPEPVHRLEALTLAMRHHRSVRPASYRALGAVFAVLVASTVLWVHQDSDALLRTTS